MIGWRTLLLLVLASATAAPGCRTREVDTAARFSDSQEFLAEAKLAPKAEAKAHGDVLLRQLVDPYTVRSGVPQVMAYVKVEGLPAGEYTVRLHDETDCAAPAPTGDTSHNARTLSVGADGHGKLTARLTKITIQPDTEPSVLGKAIVVHRGTAAEGEPVACGVIAPVAKAAEEHHGAGGGHEDHGDHGAEGDKAHGDHGGEGDKAHDEHGGEGH